MYILKSAVLGRSQINISLLQVTLHNTYHFGSKEKTFVYYINLKSRQIVKNYNIITISQVFYDSFYLERSFRGQIDVNYSET